MGWKALEAQSVQSAVAFFIMALKMTLVRSIGKASTRIPTAKSFTETAIDRKCPKLRHPHFILTLKRSARTSPLDNLCKCLQQGGQPDIRKPQCAKSQLVIIGLSWQGLKDCTSSCSEKKGPRGQPGTEEKPFQLCTHSVKKTSASCAKFIFIPDSTNLLSSRSEPIFGVPAAKASLSKAGCPPKPLW